jgi:hypothetical protein
MSLIGGEDFAGERLREQIKVKLNLFGNLCIKYTFRPPARFPSPLPFP